MSSPVEGRVLIAPDDGPLVASPTWVRLDAPGGDFPDQFVSGYDLKNGKQSLFQNTDTGTATVYINDHKFGLFDPRNSTSPYYQKLTGRQIMCQLYDPVREVWETQFRGRIDSVGYALDNTAVNSDGDPINVSIQLECVDIFDYLGQYGLTPGHDGDRPPAGGEDGVWYAATSGEAFARIIQIFGDTGINEATDQTTLGYICFSGNVAVQTCKYDPDEAALTALRDAAEANFPFISALYVDRFGRPVFHGRYGRFAAADLSNAAGVDRWDWHDWSVGDGKAVRADSTRAQMRVLEYAVARNNIVNNATCYPQGMPQEQMPNQVFADTASIDAYGHYSAPPMSDLLTAKPIDDNLNGHPDWTKYDECLAFAELLVKNQKDPREAISALQIKTVHPLDGRAEKVWAALSQMDVSDQVNVGASYPHGTGFTGTSPDDDYFIEGRTMRVRPLSASAFASSLPGYDYVELDLDVSPAVFTMDTHGVFPAWSGET